MKKHITLLLCLVLMVSLLVGCSTGGETSDGNSGVSQQDGEKQLSPSGMALPARMVMF